MAKLIPKQLPEEVLGSVTKRGIFASIFGTLMLLILFNFLALWYLKYFPKNRGDWVIQKKWEMLLNLEQPVDWLILGDSSCNQGVVPSILQEELSVSAINLCSIADTLVLNDVWMLNRYIEKYGVPRNVLIVHVYDVWNRNIAWNIMAQIPLEWGYWRNLKPQFQPNKEELTSLFLNRYVPLYSKNESLKNAIRNPTNMFSKNYHVEDDGFMVVSTPNPRRVQNNTITHLQFIKEHKFNISTPNRMALEEILSLAERHKFNVYLANSPIYEGLYENRDFAAYFYHVQQTLNSFEVRSKRVHYIFREPMTFSKNQMENADHLIDSAAKIYTHKLASELKSYEK